ncbi:MAG: DUF1499 domain-containing protein, partial [Planctomycetota bacterium]
MLKRVADGLTKNEYRLSQDDPDTRLRPWLLAMDADEVATTVDDAIAGHSRWTLLDQLRNSAGHQLHLTRRTPIFRFVDDVRLEITPSSDGCRIDAHSQSRIGKGDLGQNRRNLIELHQLLVAAANSQ